jgi:hypothetical protein
MLFGAAAGGVLGGVAAANAGKTSASTKDSTTGQPTSNAAALQALQQFAAVVPTLIQLLASSSSSAPADKQTKPQESANGAEGVGALSGAEWALEVEEGTWAIA